MIRAIARKIVPAPVRMMPRKLCGSVVDQFYGIHTEGWRKLTAAEKSATRHQDPFMYQPCTYAAIWTALRLLPTTPEDVFCDLGCGKGRAICAAAASGRFRSCIGIELAATLAEAARWNASRLRKVCPVEILTGDVASADLSRGTVFFLANPFGTDTIRAVLENIERARNGRRILIACFGEYPKEAYDGCAWLERYKASGRVGIWRSRRDTPGASA
jgi:precorrin-6B methylase 2